MEFTTKEEALKEFNDKTGYSVFCGYNGCGEGDELIIIKEYIEKV